MRILRYESISTIKTKLVCMMITIRQFHIDNCRSACSPTQCDRRRNQETARHGNIEACIVSRHSHPHPSDCILKRQKSGDDDDIHLPNMISMKSLKMIFPATSKTRYEHMFLMERVAWIYIELVVKRGYKAMNNWSFRHLAR
jgi:hypothetical protein